MNIFCNILKAQNKDYFNNSLKGDIVVNMNIYVLINFFILSGNISKYQVLNNTFLQNRFLNDRQQSLLLDVFGNAQKNYHILIKFTNRIKYRIAKRYDYNYDLLYRPLDEIQKRQTIELLENNTIYNFRTNDLVTMINKKLCYAPDFFAEPQEPINPYTNLPISKANLYKLYFHIKKNNLMVPTLIHHFFLSNFDLDIFLDNNEVLLREFSLKDYIKTASHKKKRAKVASMIYYYRNYTNFSLDYLNKDEIVTALIHLFPSYIISKYSLNNTVRFNADRKIIQELQTFIYKPRTNPFFKPQIIRQSTRRRLFSDNNEIDDSDGNEFPVVPVDSQRDELHNAVERIIQDTMTDIIDNSLDMPRRDIEQIVSDTLHIAPILPNQATEEQYNESEDSEIDYPGVGYLTAEEEITDSESEDSI